MKSCKGNIETKQRQKESVKQRIASKYVLDCEGEKGKQGNIDK